MHTVYFCKVVRVKQGTLIGWLSRRKSTGFETENVVDESWYCGIAFQSDKKFRKGFKKN